MTDINSKYINHDYSEFEDDYGNLPDDWEGKYGLLLGRKIIAIYDNIEVGFAELMHVKKRTNGFFKENGKLYQLINLSTGVAVVPFLEKQICESDSFVDWHELEDPFRGCHGLYYICKEVGMGSPKLFTSFNEPRGVLIGTAEFMEYMKWKSEQSLTSQQKDWKYEYFHIYDLLKKYEEEQNKI